MTKPRQTTTAVTAVEPDVSRTGTPEPTPARTPAQQVADYLQGRPVSRAARKAAIARHAGVTATAGVTVPLDWHTRRMLDPRSPL